MEFVVLMREKTPKRQNSWKQGFNGPVPRPSEMIFRGIVLFCSRHMIVKTLKDRWNEIDALKSCEKGKNAYI